jgi:hypothetical protein
VGGLQLSDLDRCFRLFCGLVDVSLSSGDVNVDELGGVFHPSPSWVRTPLFRFAAKAAVQLDTGLCTLT